MKSIDALMHEHRVIERGLGVLETVAERFERGENVPTEKVIALLDFFRVFADLCHHGKEEGLLFSELEAKGIPKEGGPIGVMLHEHDEGRNLQRQMREAVSDLSNEANRQKFTAAARDYIALLRQHIWKEDNVLFKMAEQVLTEVDDKELAERFERYEREHIGEGIHERYHHLVHGLELEFADSAKSTPCEKSVKE